MPHLGSFVQAAAVLSLMPMGFLPANWWQQVENLLSEQKGRFGNLPHSQRDFQSRLQRANAPEY